MSGVADSLPSGSGNFKVQPWLHQLPSLHPLQAPKRVQDGIAPAVQVVLIAQKALLAGHSQGHQVYLPLVSAFWLPRRAVCFPEGW